MTGIFDVVNVAWQSPYFQYKTNPCYANEKLLYSHLETEAFDNYGIKYMYYAMDFNEKRDRLFGEDMDRYCQRKFIVMAYIAQLPPLIPQFALLGIINPDIITIYITISHFNQASTLTYEDDSLIKPQRFPPMVPRQGDYIKSVYNKVFYEIINVRDSEESSQFHETKTTYTLNVRVWKNNNFDVSATEGVPTSSLFDISAVMHQPDFLATNDEISIEDDFIKYEQKAGEIDPTDPFGGF